MKELIIKTSTPSMTSAEIAALVGSRHDSVKRTIERLVKSGVITSPPLVEKPTAGRPVAVYVFSGEEGKRDTYVVVAQLSPEFTGLLVDRWQELENAAKEPPLPRTYKEALLHLVAQVEENERLTEQNEALDEALSIARPKAILMDRLAGTSEQLYGINEAGRILGTSGAVMASCIDREYGRNVTSTSGGHIQAKFTFKGLCYVALHLVKRGIITVDTIPYRPCRDSVEAAMAMKKSAA